MRGKKLLLLARKVGSWLSNSANGLLWDSFLSGGTSSPRTATPGPGSTLIVDTTSKFSVSGGDLVCSGGINDYNDPSVSLSDAGSGVAASAGIGLYAHITPSDATTYARVGLAQTANDDENSMFRFLNTGTIDTLLPTTQPSMATYSGGVDYKFLQILRSSGYGYYYIINGSLKWAADDATATPVFPFVGSYDKPLSLHDLALVDLSSYGFTNDFLDVTDTKTNPATGTSFGVGMSGHLNATWTHEAGTSVDFKFKYSGASSYYRVVDIANDLYVTYNTGGGDTQTGFYAAGFSDGVSYELDVIFDYDNTSLRVFLDKVLVINLSTLTQLESLTSGRVDHSLATNDIVLTTHPYPALGIATDRVVCPQTNDTATHTADCVIHCKNVVLPTASANQIRWRYVDSNNFMYCSIPADGSLNIGKVIAGAPTALITTIAGTISDNDDLVIVSDGASVQIFISGTSAGTSATAAPLTGTLFVVDTVANSGSFDYIALFPRYPSLPAELT